MTIAIIDYKVGNLGSIRNMLKHVGLAAEITADAEAIKQASHLILPGVGHFDTAMKKFNDSGLKGIVTEQVFDKNIPLLGICVGMQMLFQGSEEGDLPGLGWLPHAVKRFSFTADQKFKIPHMGWNTLDIKQPHPVLASFTETPRFYFVHSFYAPVTTDGTTLATTHHGYEFAAIVGRDNIVGAQFHPEKSHRFGMQLFKSFAENSVQAPEPKVAEVVS